MNRFPDDCPKYLTDLEPLRTVFTFGTCMYFFCVLNKSRKMVSDRFLWNLNISIAKV